MELEVRENHTSNQSRIDSDTRQLAIAGILSLLSGLILLVSPKLGPSGVATSIGIGTVSAIIAYLKRKDK